MSKCPRAASSQCPQLWSPHAGLQHLCGQKPPTPGAGTPAEHLERAESFCPLGCIQPVPSVQGLLSYQLFLGSGRTLLEVFLPQAGVKPAFPFLTQAGSPLRATVMLLACPLRPLRSQDALAPPPKASEKLQIRCDLNLVRGASLFTVKENIKQKTTTLFIHFTCTKPGKAFLALTAHSFLDVGILLQDASGTEAFILRRTQLLALVLEMICLL